MITIKKVTIRPWKQQQGNEQPGLHPQQLLDGKVGFCFETKHGGYVLVFVHLLNVLSSDGIPIRAGDDIDGDDSEELQYEWSTEGEREIEPGRDSPLVDQVCAWGLFLSLWLDHTTVISGAAASPPRPWSASRGGGRGVAGERPGGGTGTFLIIMVNDHCNGQVIPITIINS